MMDVKKNIYQKLAEAKAGIGSVTKDRLNPFHKNKYADINSYIEVIEPHLLAHGLLLLQPLVQIENKFYVKTQIIDTEDGTSIDSILQIPEGLDPQKTGSAITYFRRYTLASLLSMQAHDEDGNEASKPAPKGKTRKYLYDIAELLDSENKEEVLTYLKKNGVSLDLDKKIATSFRELEKLKNCDYETIEY